MRPPGALPPPHFEVLPHERRFGHSGGRFSAAQRVAGRTAASPLGEATRGESGDMGEAESHTMVSSYHIGAIAVMAGSPGCIGGPRSGAESGPERAREARERRPNGGVRQRAAGEFRRPENHRGPEAPWGWATDFVLGIWVVRENEGRCGEGRESANGADMRGAVGEGTRRRFLSTKRPEGFGRKIVAPRVAVGTALSGGPPHRSRRAGLPHRALALGQTRRRSQGYGCRIRGSGNQQAMRRCIRSHVIRVLWLRRRRMPYHSRPTRVRNAPRCGDVSGTA